MFVGEPADEHVDPVAFACKRQVVRLFAVIDAKRPVRVEQNGRAAFFQNAAGVPAVAAALTVVALVYLVSSTPLTDAALGWPSWARIVLVMALLFPIGLLLGTFLPHGIDLALAAAGGGPGEGRLVAWCWAVNGFFSVIGALATTISSMTFGFDRTLLIGLFLYLVAASVSMATPRTPAPVATSPVAAPAPVSSSPAAAGSTRRG